jgi:hypothetical protein
MPYLPGQFPVAEALCREYLSLPCNPNVGEAEIDYVVEQVRVFYALAPLRRRTSAPPERRRGDRCTSHTGS